ncbi:hypothetical protein SH449x_000952 [Pirellulaceae bacterium SH449]
MTVTIFDAIELSDTDRQDYRRLLSIVQTKRDAFAEVLDAMSEIRSRRLYRENYSSFERFCEVELGMSRQNFDKLEKAQRGASRLREHAPEQEVRIKSIEALGALERVPDEYLADVVRNAESHPKLGTGAPAIEESASRIVPPKPRPEHEQVILPGLESEVLSKREIMRIKKLTKHFQAIGSLDDQAAFLCRHFHDLAVRIAERVTE